MVLEMNVYAPFFPCRMPVTKNKQTYFTPIHPLLVLHYALVVRKLGI